MPDLELAVPYVTAENEDILSESGSGRGPVASPVRLKKSPSWASVTSEIVPGGGDSLQNSNSPSPTSREKTLGAPDRVEPGQRGSHRALNLDQLSGSMRESRTSRAQPSPRNSFRSVDPQGQVPRRGSYAPDSPRRISMMPKEGSPSRRVSALAPKEKGEDGQLPSLPGSPIARRPSRLQGGENRRQSHRMELPPIVEVQSPKGSKGSNETPNRLSSSGVLPPLAMSEQSKKLSGFFGTALARAKSRGNMSASPQGGGSGKPNLSTNASAQLKLLAEIHRGSRRRDRTNENAGESPGTQKRASTEEVPMDPARSQLRQKCARLLNAIATCHQFISMLKPDNKDPVVAQHVAEKSEWTRMKPAKPKTSSSEGGAEAKPKEPDVRVSLSRIALPTAADLHNLPIDLQNTFTTLALETLRKYLYPKLLLWNRKKEREAMRESHTTQRLTVDILRRQEMFKAWPDSILQEVCISAVVECYNKDEFIIHEDEQAGSGIYFVMTGAVQVLKKKSRETKAIGGDNALVLVQLNPIICVGEFSFLTEEPRMASIRACTRVDCWVLKKNDFARFVSQLPNTIFQSVIDVAFAARNKNMHLSYPLTEKILRETPIFRPCPSSMLIELLQGARPYAVPKNLKICRGDWPADRIFFLRNGRCGLMRTIARKIYERRASETLIGTIKAPTVFGETAVMHGGGYGDSVMTLSTCDFWVLNKVTFDSVVRRHRGVDSMMMAEARSQRQEQLSSQQNLFRECVYEIPLLKEAATRQQLRALVHRFDAHVYKPLSVICSTTRFADRLVILYKGRVRVGPKHQEWNWAKGECAGFTCVVPHRWAHSAVAADIVECLELPLATYVDFLKTNKLYSSVVRWVKQLLFPAAFDPSVADAAEDLVAHLKSPPMYPRSTSTKVKLHEEGFGGAHYSHLSYLGAGTHLGQIGQANQTEAAMIMAVSPKRAKIRQGSIVHQSLPFTSGGGLAQAESLESGSAKRAPKQWVRMSSFVWKKPLKQYGSTDRLGICQALRRAGKSRRRAVETSVDDLQTLMSDQEWRALI